MDVKLIDFPKIAQFKKALVLKGLKLYIIYLFQVKEAHLFVHSRTLYTWSQEKLSYKDVNTTIKINTFQVCGMGRNTQIIYRVCI